MILQVVGEAFEATTVVERVEGTDLIDLDGNHLQDISGSYGLNVIGYGRYKEMLAEGNKVCQELSCALGPLNPLQVRLAIESRWSQLASECQPL
jgi:glutamate-1-semialdehyde 2,1-aminomutase|eukprot:COSAG01_NODE_26215_length_720_cov_10.164251_2_plen_94_part_00